MAEPPPGPLAPGSVIGILGGGQLGRMLAIAAARLGLRSRIYDPDPRAPAGQIAPQDCADWADGAALRRFAAAVDVVTLEFENVPAEALRRLAALRPVRPGPLSLETAQDRAREKAFLSRIGLATAEWRAVGSAAALAAFGAPAILKTRRMGYDGRGQVRIGRAEEAEAAFAALGALPCIAERVVPFRSEVSVIGVRGADGRVIAYDPAENLHEDGILRRSRVPAALPRGLAEEAVRATGRILAALDHVGAIGVEFFVTQEGRLLVNEFAPRVHNSGHWTIEACVIDQFAAHVRAVAGWPIGDGARHSDAEMENLIGAEAERWAALAAEPGAGLHLYGKAEIRPGRKMGHVTRLRPRGR